MSWKTKSKVEGPAAEGQEEACFDVAGRQTFLSLRGDASTSLTFKSWNSFYHFAKLTLPCIQQFQESKFYFTKFVERWN